MLQISLNFKATECRGCGVQRQVSVVCTDCGQRPDAHEVDTLVQARVRAVESARNLLDPGMPACSLGPVELMQAPLLSELAERVYEAADQIALGNETGVPLFAETGIEVAALRAWVQKANDLRPLHKVTRLLKEAVVSLTALYEGALGVLTARRIDEAQQLQGAMQASLDSAVDAVDRLGVVAESLSFVLEHDNPLTGWLQLAGDFDYRELTKRGERCLKDRGFDASSPAAAFLASLWDCVVSNTSDTDAFWATVSDQVDVLSRSDESVRAIVREPDFRNRFGTVLNDQLHFARRAVVAVNSSTPREEVTELLEAAHLEIEQTLKLHLGLGCATTTRMSFAMTQARDVSELINIARDQGWAMDAVDHSRDLRNAISHRDYEVDEHGNTSLSPMRRRTQGEPEVVISKEQLLDRTMGIQESCAALQLALALVADDAFDAVTIDSPSLFLTVCFAESLLGWTEVDGTFTDGLVQIRGTAHRRVSLSDMSILNLPNLAGAEHALVSIVDAASGALSVVEIPLDIYREWANTDERTAALDRGFALVRLQQLTIVNERPIMDIAQVTKYVSRSVLKIMSEGRFAEVRHALDTWRLATETFGDPHLVDTIAAAYRWKATADLGLNTSQAGLDALVAEASREVPVPSIWIS